MALNLHHGNRHLVTNPHRVVDQHFGMGLTPDDLLGPMASLAPFQQLLHGNYLRPWRLENQDVGSTIKFNKDNFQVNLDVQHFAPEEITVKVVDNSIVVEGNHEEKPDDHGYISRKFVRRYDLPKEYRAEDIVSTLSTDGVLTLCAPKSTEQKEKLIPIKSTGVPHKAIKHK